MTSAGSSKEFDLFLSQVTPLLSSFIARGLESSLSDDESQNQHASNGSLPHEPFSNVHNGHAVRAAARCQLTSKSDESPSSWSPHTLTTSLDPVDLIDELGFSLPECGEGRDGVLRLLGPLLHHSVNTWHQGFLDKLYASTNPVGVVAELVLSVLNTNVHVYNVSPVLTIIEKTVGRELAAMFGFTGPNAGGITQPGGSGANLTALVIGRNTLHPHTKTAGCADQRLVLFTSAHGHYSFEKAAQICGLGSDAAWSVAVHADGSMNVDDLRRQIKVARETGYTPFFVNATAGTTVLGSYDPFEEIAKVCQDEKLWFHIDGSWGGPAIFAPDQRCKLRGSHLANSITMNPHKMMGVPITCSFLLARDLRTFWRSNTLPAGYLFHTGANTEAAASDDENIAMPEVWDLADLTLQCGRKGDALKLAFSWIYYGRSGYASRISGAFSVAAELASLVASKAELALESPNPPPCLQVCFYYNPEGPTAFPSKEIVSTRTKAIAKALSRENFLVDYAPGTHGLMLRVVVSLVTQRETVRRLVNAVATLGQDQVKAEQRMTPT